jgi:NAD(P)-dependent dehydrogenase (short-subunit alcohol dehydrogenase family)
MPDFTSKVALVTGGGKGIGRASALCFASGGASVGVLDLDGDAAMGVVREIEAAGGRALALVVDVRDEAAIADAVAQVVSAYGRLDCAHNNAGMMNANQLIDEVALDDWNLSIAVNLTSVFLSMKHQIPAMAASGGGAIVNTASIGGHNGARLKAAYVAAKHGVVGLTKAAAMDAAARDIRVNAVSPGSVDTPMLRDFVGGDETLVTARERATLLGRLGQPDEIARAAVWLCSDEASFITGTSLIVDGGR